MYFGVAVDLFSDRVMIGTGSTIDLSLGLVLALGQTPADIPEGFATIATFKAQNIARSTRILLSLSFAVPIFLGATLGYWAVRGSSEVVKFGLLAFTAGILLTIVIEEIVPEAHRGKEAELAALALVSGFALFGFITVYL
ncbi:ZIP family metal transporter [Haladaptatus halobius]|uniref:ZIP family metal transporter n=1 Tax=Haladaptatus halobius TaxID=2884875 RepID=UPI001D0BCC0C